MDITQICRQLSSLRQQPPPPQHTEQLETIAAELATRSRSQDDVDALCSSEGISDRVL